MRPRRLADLFRPGCYAFVTTEARRRTPGTAYWLHLPADPDDLAFTETVTFNADGTATCTRDTPTPPGQSPPPPIVTTLWLEAGGVWLQAHASAEWEALAAKWGAAQPPPEPQLWLPFTETQDPRWGHFRVEQDTGGLRVTQTFPEDTDLVTETLYRPGEWVSEYAWLSGHFRTRHRRAAWENRPT